MIYSWNDEKAKSNYKKHGIRFEEAQVIWSDFNALEYVDPDSHLYGEERFLRIGLNPQRGLLLVSFCEREGGDNIRIISARKATKSERDVYEEELRS